jgi:hypothetical protein
MSWDASSEFESRPVRAIEKAPVNVGVFSVRLRLRLADVFQICPETSRDSHALAQVPAARGVIAAFVSLLFCSWRGVEMDEP